MSPSLPEPLHVFYSLAPDDEDRALALKLEQHLELLKVDGLIDSVSIKDVGTDEDQGKDLEARMGRADIILLLVSPAFLASKRCREDVKRAMDLHARRQARAVPVIMRPCDWAHAPGSVLQALPRDGRPITAWTNVDDVMLEITKGIRAVVQSLQAPGAAPSPPGREDRARTPEVVPEPVPPPGPDSHVPAAREPHPMAAARGEAPTDEPAAATKPWWRFW